MDLRQYFRKIQEVENGLSEAFPLVVSLETSDGGKAGLIVELRAVVASEEQKVEFLAKQALAKKFAENADAARRVQVAIVSESDLHHYSGRKNK